MAADSFTEALTLHLRAQLPLLVTDTVEEQRVVAKAAEVCRALGMRCLTWDAASGFCSVLDGQRMAPTTDPSDVLQRLTAMSADTLVVLKDLHALWDDPRLLRAVRNYAQRPWTQGPTALVVGAGLVLPDDLRDEAVMLSLPPPDRRELDALVHDVATRGAARRELSEEDMSRLVDAAAGLTYAQAERAFIKAVVRDGVLSAGDIAAVFADKREILRADGALEYLEPHVGVDDVGGLAALKEWLDLRARTFGQQARDFGLPAPKGVALIGIPGTGKSLTAKVIGAAWGLPLLRLDVGALYHSLMGESEARARRSLQTAEVIAPCVVWIDELEKALAHGGQDTGTSTRVVGTILTWMAEKTAPCFVVATANDIAALPPELLRRGRFDEVFFLDLPTAQERAEILSVHLRRARRDPAAFDVSAVARATDGFVGAELEHVVTDALLHAFDADRELTDGDLLHAAGHVVPLARSQRERVEQLRAWLREGRARSASSERY